MNRYIYLDRDHAGFLIVTAPDKWVARNRVCAEYGYEKLPRHFVLTRIAGRA